MVSICMITYNHEPYIREAIEGVLMQQCSFPFELVIGEDCSTDLTLQICKKYAREHPEIHLLSSESNLGSMKNLLRTLQACKNKYIALCEGDDYWTDPLKLQKQVEFLEGNEDCSLVFHAATIISASNKRQTFVKRNDNNRYFSMEELIMGGGGLIVTNSILFSKDMLSPHMDWFKDAIVGDYPLALTAGIAGKVFYIDDVMSVYRTDVQGAITSQRDLLPYQAFIDRSLKLMDILKDFDKYTRNKYSDVVKLKISKYLYNQFEKKNDVPIIARYRAYKKLKNDLLKNDRRNAIKHLAKSTPLLSLLFLFKKKFAIIVKKVLSLFSVKRIYNYYIRINRKKEDIHPAQITLSSINCHTFFGYYDINPFSSTEDNILAMRVDSELSSPKPGRLAELGYFKLNDNNHDFISFASTQTWNWQQGCRLQWYTQNNDKTVLFNTMIADHYGAVVMEPESGIINQQIDYPLYHVEKTGKWGLSLNFSRLHRLRPGYGYAVLHDETENELCPANDGVWLIDIRNNKSKLLFSLAELPKISPHESMSEAQHYINHLCFNPSGSAFMFFHLWVDTDNRRHSRLFVSDTDGSSLKLLVNTGHVSHYTWFSDEKLLVTTYVTKNRQLRYVIYDIHQGFDSIIGINNLTFDGHPSFFREGNFIVTDTYPDEYRDQKLLLFNTEKEQVKVIDRFNSPIEFKGELRCDLHPRISPSGTKICIDMPEVNLRVMKIIDISMI